MDTQYAQPDPIGREYVRLALHIDHHVPGFIDAYFGPPEWKAEAEAEGKIAPAELRHQAETLLHEMNAVPEIEETRREWLTKQITAMSTMLRQLEGETLAFEQEITLLYDIQPVRASKRELEDALRVLEDLVPGAGSLAERLEAWNAQFDIPRDKLLPALTYCRDEARRRTRQLFKLPEDEEIHLQLVEGQEWIAYNWYLGNYRSRVEVNTDLPVRANDMLFLMSHEGYPGHHTEHAIKEQRLYRQQGRTEACVQLLNAPECVISEGIANLAWQIIFTEQELKEWLQNELYPRAGINARLATRDRAIVHARRKLSPADGNAAFMMHHDGADEQSVMNYLQRYGVYTEKQARQMYCFLSNPLYRSYIFNYYYGRELLNDYVKAGDSVSRFQTLLEQALTPSRVKQWITLNK